MTLNSLDVIEKCLRWDETIPQKGQKKYLIRGGHGRSILGGFVYAKNKKQAIKKAETRKGGKLETSTKVFHES